LPAEPLKLAVLIPPADYAAEWRWAYDIEAQALADAGAEVEPVDWTGERDFSAFDLVLPLVAWGYHKDYSRWLRLLDRLESRAARIENPIALLRWNGDKAYLAELCEQGVPTVPSLVIESLDEQAIDHARAVFGGSDIVVKPLVSASAYGTFRLRGGDAFPESVRGWRMLAQPWIQSITTAGEYSILLFGGEFSHSVSKVPVDGEFRVQPEFGGIIDRCDPPDGAIQIAKAALAAAPAPATYARADLVVGNDGELQLMELELIEPALFLEQAPDTCPSFARAVLASAERAREQPLADR
jgi:glutathione synthase/RimK-type ligase-like ATP-grasp enzyme